ncbi:MAG TPA: thioredoxin domain-containing protein [Terriglobales bacterium]|nr:thioredoxin domain-containing protein [Terriglobales bacterium]
MRKVLLATWVAALCSAMAIGQAAETETKGTLPSREVVDSFLHHTFGYDPNIKWEISDIKPAEDPAISVVSIVLRTPQGGQEMKLFITPDQKYAIAGDMLPFGSNPYARVADELKRQLTGPARGATDAKVTIVEFGDLQCPACRAAQATIDKLMGDVPTARLVFQEFPLITLHKWAFAAAKYGECAREENPDAFWKFQSLVYDNQSSMESLDEDQAIPKLKDYAVQAGATAAKVDACFNNPATAAKIYESMELGKKMEVTSTPTLFINGRKVQNVTGMPYEVLKNLTEFQAQQ